MNDFCEQDDVELADYDGELDQILEYVKIEDTGPSAPPKLQRER